jgi:hypothetical protein
MIPLVRILALHQITLSKLVAHQRQPVHVMPTSRDNHICCRTGKSILITMLSANTMASQARHAISTMDTWGNEDGHFDYGEFWHGIVGLFDDPEDEWCVATLTWWDL